jgi:hypothetical protein
VDDASGVHVDDEEGEDGTEPDVVGLDEVAGPDRVLSLCKLDSPCGKLAEDAEHRAIRPKRRAIIKSLFCPACQYPGRDTSSQDRAGRSDVVARLARELERAVSRTCAPHAFATDLDDVRARKRERILDYVVAGGVDFGDDSSRGRVPW